MILAILTTVFWNVVVFLICYFGIRDNWTELYKGELIPSIIRHKLKELKESRHPDINEYNYVAEIDKELEKYNTVCSEIQKYGSYQYHYTTLSWMVLVLLLPVALFTLLVTHKNQSDLLLLFPFLSLTANIILSSIYCPKSKIGARLEKIEHETHNAKTPNELLELAHEAWFVIYDSRPRGYDREHYTLGAIVVSIVYTIILLTIFYLQ